MADPHVELLTKLLAEQQACKQLLDHACAELAVANLGPDRIIEFVAHDQVIKLWLPFARSDWIQSRILRGRNFFEAGILDKLRPYLRPGMIILDIGANIGNHSVFFSKICGATKVHAFEPQRVPQKIFRKNIELNACTGIVLHECALGDKQQRASISAFRSNNLGATRFAPDLEGEFQVLPLDELDLPKVDFMKIDVEGGQAALLAGAKSTIERTRPVIFIELLGEKNEVADANKILQEWGYNGSVLHPDNYLYLPTKD